MKKTFDISKLKLPVLLAGLLGTALRMALYTTGTDRKGLLVSGHWAGTALWILTGLVAALLIFCRRSLPAQSRREEVPSPLGAVGSFLCAVLFALEGGSGFRSIAGTLELLLVVMCFLSAGALVYVGLCRTKGSSPHFLAHCALCVCFALRMVCYYRVWSSDPQLMDYCFYMLAHVCLMLTAYQHTARDAGQGNCRKLVFAGLGAGYLSLVCLWGSSDPLFLLVCGIWAVTGLPHSFPAGKEE